MSIFAFRTLIQLAIILTCWHLIFATILTQILARTTRLLDGRKSISMDTRMYCRSIIPIGLLYCGSLVCSNVVYLYLNISFIQMLKVPGCFWTFQSTLFWFLPGCWPCCHTDHKLVLEGCQTVSGGFYQHPCHYNQCRTGCVRRGQIFLAWLLLPICESGLWCKPVGHGADSPVRQRVQDGSFGQPLLFRTCVCSYDLGGCQLYRIPYFRMESSDADWLDGAASKCCYWIHAQCFNLLAGSLFLWVRLLSIWDLADMLQIGKTSGLAMTLISIPKNILLIAISVLLWHTPIHPLQILGYTVALVSLLFYSLGWSTIKGYMKSVELRGGKTEENGNLLANEV